MDIKQKVGTRIRELRHKSKLSQEALAYQADLDRTYMTDVENGRRNISIENLEKIIIALNITIPDFFNSELFNKNI
jgi:transcriptional regulator with XRE-family HTH domain